MKVLFVDNENDILSLLEIAFETEDDIDLVCERDSARAAERIGQEEFDLYIFDLMMPAPDGKALLGRVRAVAPDAPAIICTAKADNVARQELLAAGATEVLHKPFDPLTLPDHLRRYARA
ncbi:response regulator [Aquicoccus sp. SCR17]|nr:response regulator [Carideicomes alvinocaridis]